MQRLEVGDFHLHRCLEEPDLHVMEVSIFPKSGAVWEFKAKVVWINRDMAEPEGEFHLGLDFMEQKGLPVNWRQQLGKGS